MKLHSVPPSQSLDSCNFLWFHLLCSFRFEQIFVLETIFLSIFHCSFFLLLRNGNIYPSAYPATRIRIIIPKTCSKLFSVHYFSVFPGNCAFIKNARICKIEKLPLGNIDLRKIQDVFFFHILPNSYLMRRITRNRGVFRNIGEFRTCRAFVIEAVKYLHKKGPSQMFCKALTTPLSNLLRIP